MDPLLVEATKMVFKDHLVSVEGRDSNNSGLVDAGCPISGRNGGKRISRGSRISYWC